MLFRSGIIASTSITATAMGRLAGQDPVLRVAAFKAAFQILDSKVKVTSNPTVISNRITSQGIKVIPSNLVGVSITSSPQVFASGIGRFTSGRFMQPRRLFHNI